MATLYEDFEIDQGTDVALTVQLRDINGSAKNLTNYSAAATLKVNYNADTGTPFSTIVAGDPADGIVTMSLTNEQTDALNTRYRYVYDLELSFQDIDGNTLIEKVLRGTMKINPSVT